MERTKKVAQKIMPIVRALLIAYAVTGIMLLILALLLYKVNMGEGAVTAGIIIVYIVSCFLGGWTAGHNIGHKKYLWGFLTGVCYFLLLVVISAAFQQGSMAGVRYLITAFAMCAGGGMVGGMISG